MAKSMARDSVKAAVLVIVAAILATLGGCYGGGTDEASNFPLVDPSAPATFQNVNAAVFTPVCAKCHSSWFGNEDQLLSRGKLILPGDPANSEIYQKVESGEMPPPSSGLKLTDSQIDLVRRYIEQAKSGKPGPSPSSSPSPSPGPSPSPTPPNPNANFTWLSANLFQVSCMQCHSTATHKGKIILDTAAGAKAAGMDAYNEIDTGDMPPSDATPPRPAVTVEAKAALLDWIQAGSPE